MKRDKKRLRHTKNMARYFKKNNIYQIDFNNDLPLCDFLPNGNIKIYRLIEPKITVTFIDGTQKEAKSYQSYPLKIEYKEKTNDN